MELSPHSAPTTRQPQKLAEFKRPLDITTLFAKHRLIVRMNVSGSTPLEICNELKVSRRIVNAVLESEVGQQYAWELEAGVEEKCMETATVLQNSAHVSAALMSQVLHKEGEAEDATLTQRIGVARDVLDRTGYGKQTTLNISGTMTHEEKRGCDELAQRAADMGIIDVTPVEVHEEENGA